MNKLELLDNMEWISVEDRLPQEHTSIIVFAPSACEKVYTTKVFVSEDCIETGNKLVDYETYGGDVKITHWMPLPEPPSEHPKERSIKEINVNITRNAIKCLECGDIIESKHRHDFVECKCKKCFVDGGLDYLKRGGDPTMFEDRSKWEVIYDNKQSRKRD